MNLPTQIERENRDLIDWIPRCLIVFISEFVCYRIIAFSCLRSEERATLDATIMKGVM